MFKKFDPNGQIVERARSLIDKPVLTSVWKPEEYPPLEWFRDIRKVEIAED